TRRRWTRSKPTRSSPRWCWSTIRGCRCSRSRTTNGAKSAGWAASTKRRDGSSLAMNGRADADRHAFILANTDVLAPPHVPEISLRLAAEAHELWLKTEDELQAIGLPPPFWAFAWAGGQGLARYVLDHPD